MEKIHITLRKKIKKKFITAKYFMAIKSMVTDLFQQKIFVVINSYYTWKNEKEKFHYCKIFYGNKVCDYRSFLTKKFRCNKSIHKWVYKRKQISEYINVYIFTSAIITM